MTKAELLEIAGWFDEAAEDVGSWGAYASPYFQHKHDLPSDIAQYMRHATYLRQLAEQMEGD